MLHSSATSTVVLQMSRFTKAKTLWSCLLLVSPWFELSCIEP